MSKKSESLEILQKLYSRLNDRVIIERFKKHVDEFEIKTLQDSIKSCLDEIKGIPDDINDIDILSGMARADNILKSISSDNFDVDELLKNSYFFIMNSSCTFKVNTYEGQRSKKSDFFQYLVDDKGYDVTALTPHKFIKGKKWDLLIRDIHRNYLATVKIILATGDDKLPKIIEGADDLECFLVVYNIEEGILKYYRMVNNIGLKELDDFPTYEQLQHMKGTSNAKNIAIPTQIKLRKKTETRPVLGVKSIAKTLSSIIKNYPDESGMMIAVLGNWGRGKTFLMEETWKTISNENSSYKRVSFSAWKYQDTKESWAYLYEVFVQAYLKDSSEISLDFLKNKHVLYNRHRKEYKRYLNAVRRNNKVEKLEESLNSFSLLRRLRNSRFYKLIKLNLNKFGWTPLLLFFFGAMLFFTFGKLTLLQSIVSAFGLFFVLKIVTFYFLQKTKAVDLYRKYFSRSDYTKYLGLQAEIEGELSLLLNTWLPNKVWSTSKSHDEKIVLFVDDIDRCNFEQIISIVDGLRIILDNGKIHKRLIIVLAIDDEIFERAFKEKYKSLGFSDEKDLYKRYQEYLEKIFIIGIKLNELVTEEIKDFTEEFLPSYKEVEEKLVVKPAITKWKKDELGDKMCLVTTPAEYKMRKKIVEEKELKKEDKEYSFKRYETISKEVDGEVITEKILSKDNDVEITEDERLYFKDAIIRLNNATPRRIKILYYQLLIVKQLLHIRLNEKELLKKWNSLVNEKIIIDALIMKKNNDQIEFKKSKLIEQELQYVIDMVVLT